VVSIETGLPAEMEIEPKTEQDPEMALQGLPSGLAELDDQVAETGEMTGQVLHPS